MRRVAAAATFLVLTTMISITTHAATSPYRPQHVPPSELERALGAYTSEGRVLLTWHDGDRTHVLEVRRNDPANLLLFTGDDDAVQGVIELAKSYDQPARQIALEARIVEVDTDRAKDLGIDWNQLVLSASGESDGSRRHTNQEQSSTNPSGTYSYSNESETVDGFLRHNTRLTLTNALHLLDSNGASTTRDMPRVITLNNRTATIFDGHRVTFTTRANGYASIYQADTMDAGLKLDVTPSLVESGILRLKLTAELTDLVLLTDNTLRTTQYASLAGSPIKRGQIVENTIMARAGEPIVLGGFTRVNKLRSKQKFPILGSVLPFLFSREIERESHRASLLTLTPRVVDLDAGPTPAEKDLLDKN